MRSIVYGGLDFSDFCSAEVVERVALPMDVETMAVPGRAGALLVSGRIPPRLVVVRLFMDAGYRPGTNALADVRHRVYAALCSTHGAMLRLPDEPELEYRDVVCTDAGSWSSVFEDGHGDEEFTLLDHRERMITKMPIRLLSLQALDLPLRHTLWDIGFCTGSVSIEAKLQFPHLHIEAFEIRQECDDSRYIREKQQYQYLDAEIRQNLLGDLTHCRLGDTGSYEQVYSHRRCDHSDGCVDDHDDTKSDRRKSDSVCQRQEDRCHQEDDRLCLQEHSEEQQDYVHDEQQSELVAEQADHACSNSSWDIAVCHVPSER